MRAETYENGKTWPIEQGRVAPTLQPKVESRDYESFVVERGASGQWEVLATQSSGEYSRRPFDRPMEASAYIADIRKQSPNVRNETSGVTSGRFVEAVVADTSVEGISLPKPDRPGVHLAVDAQKALAAGIANMKWDDARLSNTESRFPLSVGVVAVDGAGNGRLIQAATTRGGADDYVGRLQTQPGLQYKVIDLVPAETYANGTKWPMEQGRELASVEPKITAQTTTVVDGPTSGRVSLPNPERPLVPLAVDAQKALAAGISNMKWDDARLPNSDPHHPLSVAIVAVEADGTGRVIHGTTTREGAEDHVGRLRIRQGLEYKIIDLVPAETYANGTKWPMEQGRGISSMEPKIEAQKSAGFDFMNAKSVSDRPSVMSGQVLNKPVVVLHGPVNYCASLELFDPETSHSLNIKDLRLSPEMARMIGSLERGSEITITADLKVARDISDPQRRVGFVDVLDLRILEHERDRPTADSPRDKSSSFEL